MRWIYLLFLVALVGFVALFVFQNQQEMSLTFVPKLLAVGLVIVISAPWMLRNLMQFTISFFSRLPEMAR